MPVSLLKMPKVFLDIDETYFRLGSLFPEERFMYWINAIAKDQSLPQCCFVFESFTIAQIIADKLERHGLVVEIRDRDWEPIVQIPEDPHRRLMGAHL